MPALRSLIAPPLLFALLLTGCGGHSPWTGSDPNNSAGAPSAPQNLAINAGDGAVSLGWAVPATPGSTAISYNVAIAPTASAAQITIDGTSALIRGLSNNTTYTFSVTASNTSGTGTAASIQATPAAAKSASSYTTVAVSNDTDGISEPALLRASNGNVWLTYSGITINNAGQITNSETRIALSSDGGNSYAFTIEVGSRANTQNDCGTPCTGTWQYRTPWLIEDSTDPNAARRFKLFAHKYYVDISNNPHYDVGTIVMWTAASPDGTWSQQPQVLLGWSSLTASFKVNTLDTSLQSCLWVDEGSATIYNSGIDLALSCALDSVLFSRNIVLLRSTDHFATLTYVATLLQPADATSYNANSFSAATIPPAGGNAPALLATLVDNGGTALGCIVLPIANETTGKLFTASSAPLSIQTLTPLNDGGRCAWDRGLLSTGVLMGNRAGNTFTLQATGKSL